MNVVLTAEEIEFNSHLDPLTVLRKMGFAAEAMTEEGNLIRIYCPIHKDLVRRSLIIEKGENKFRCQYKDCPAHEGGRLVEFVALYLGVSVPDAIAQMSQESRPEQQMVLRADRLIESGQMNEAVRLLEEAVRIAPRNEITRCKLAALYLELGRRDQGFREYLTAAEDFAVKNQTEKTLSIYNILVMLSPQDVRVRRQMAFLFSRLGRPKEASEQLKWVVDQLLARGEVEEAIKTARQVLDLCSTEPAIHMHLARLLSQARRINEAVAEAQATAELALQGGDRKIAEEAVTFGLIYNPLHERLRELETQLRETASAAQEEVGGALGQADNFNEWLQSLEEEVIREPVGAHMPTPPPTAGTSTIRREKWLAFCRGTLADLDQEKMESMGQHLRAMFEDAQGSFQAGFLDEWELNVLKDFYTSFCKAYDLVRKSKDTPDTKKTEG
jgi:tetratricopeptide (TPR) repeat protein